MTKSKVIPSKFGDERLFFKHENKNPDFDFKPEWRREFPKTDRTEFVDTLNRLGDWPTDQDEAKSLVSAQMAASLCPFAWLLSNEDFDIIQN